MTRADRWLGALLVAGLVLGCMTDHEALEKRPNTGAGAGAGGALGAAGSATQFAGADAKGANGGGHSDDEPPGQSVFTILNGLVDAPSVVLCLAKVDAGGGVTQLGSPLGGAPVAYAQSLVVPTISGASLETDTVQPFALAGELDLVAGLGCEAAVARAQEEELAAQHATAADLGAAGEGGVAGSRENGPFVQLRARLRVAGLPAIPAGTLSAGRSILYVATGCMGGATYTAKSATEYCGAGYTEQAPTASAVLLSLSRKTQLHFTGLQFVHASLATPTVAVSSRPPFLSQGASLAIASDVVEGQVAPRSALVTNAASAYGTTELYRVEVDAQGAALGSFDWALALQSGGVARLSDGSTYALVLLGPRADHAQATSLWNASAMTLIAVDPN